MSSMIASTLHDGSDSLRLILGSSSSSPSSVMSSFGIISAYDDANWSRRIDLISGDSTMTIPDSSSVIIFFAISLYAFACLVPISTSRVEYTDGGRCLSTYDSGILRVIGSMIEKNSSCMFGLMPSTSMPPQVFWLTTRYRSMNLDFEENDL